MKPKKIKLIIPIILIIIAIWLIIMAFVLNNNTTKKNTSTLNENIKKEVTYSCKTLLEDEGRGYLSYLIETIYVVDDIVIRTTPTIEIYCSNEEVYLDFKNDDNYSQGKTFNDESYMISFSNGETSDLTKDADGQEMTLKFTDYVKDLTEVGYTCKEIKE